MAKTKDNEITYVVARLEGETEFRNFLKNNTDSDLQVYSDYEYRHRDTIDTVNSQIEELYQDGEMTKDEALAIPGDKIVHEVINMDHSNYNDDVNDVIMEHLEKMRDEKMDKS